MAATGGRRAGAERAVKILIASVALSVCAVAAFFVVAAGMFYLKYDEPDPALAERFAAAVRAADGRIDLAQVNRDGWDSVSLFGPFTALEEVRACIGAANWDQDGALADHLNRENQSALVFVKNGAVSAATWSIWQHLPFEAPENLCAVPRAEAVFSIATRIVRDAKAGDVAVFSLARAQ